MSSEFQPKPPPEPQEDDESSLYALLQQVLAQHEENRDDVDRLFPLSAAEWWEQERLYQLREESDETEGE